MTKEAEIQYFEKMSPEAQDYARDKPFSADDRGAYLMDIGQILALLPPPPRTLLDLGCGSGWTSAMYARSGYAVTGVDIAPAAIEMAKESYGPTGAMFKAMDFESMPFDEEFDAVVIYDCLHHADSEELVLRSVFRALRPGGEVVIMEPGKGHHTSESSQWAVEAHGVTEKEMPPTVTVPLLRKIGFDGVRVYPRTQFQYAEKRPTGGVAKRLRPLFGAHVASLVKNLKNSMARNVNGVVSASKPASA